MQDPCVSESKCSWLCGWDPAGTLGMLKGPALGAGVSSAASPRGSPFPASACIHIQSYIFQQLIHDTGCIGAELLFFRVQGGWDKDVGSG